MYWNSEKMEFYSSQLFIFNEKNRLEKKLMMENI